MKKKEEKAIPDIISKEKEKRKSAEELNKILLENFVNIQKIMILQTEKMDKLSNNISQLLHLFEMSARSFMERPEIKETEKDKEFLEKLNSLLDQNKTIAKGLTLMEERFRERVYGQRTEQQPAQQQPIQQQFQQQPSQLSNIKKLPRF